MGGGKKVIFRLKKIIIMELGVVCKSGLVYQFVQKVQKALRKQLNISRTRNYFECFPKYRCRNHFCLIDFKKCGDLF